MRRYVTTNYYVIGCNCGSFISPGLALSAIYTFGPRLYRSVICVRGGTIERYNWNRRDTLSEIISRPSLVLIAKRRGKLRKVPSTGDRTVRSNVMLHGRPCISMRICAYMHVYARARICVCVCVWLGVKNTPPDLDTLCKTTYPRKLYAPVFFPGY